MNIDRHRFASCLIAMMMMAAGQASAQQPRDLARADGARTPVLVYGPTGACPQTLIASHGLGGDERGLDGLARAMAARGWRVLVMGHRESGPSLLRQSIFSGGDGTPRDRLIAAATDPRRHGARALDLNAALAEATRGCRPPRLVLAGHSMGAATTMIEAGAVPRFGPPGANRFDAYVALSPQGVGVFWTEQSWRAVTKPVLMITGTRDSGADGDYTTRLEAFRRLPAGPHRLAVIDGAGHLALSGGSEAMGQRHATLISDFLDRRASRLAGISITEK